MTEKTKKRYYVAHSKSLQEKIRSKELELEKELGIVILNPFIDNVDSQMETKYKGLVEEDLELLNSADGVIVYIRAGVVSKGTDYETWQGYLNSVANENYVVYIITPDPECASHPWVKYITRFRKNKLFSSFDELKAYLKEQKVDKN